MKKIKVVRFIVFGMIVTFASRLIFAPGVFAVNIDLGSQDTAYKKLLFTAVADCIDKGGKDLGEMDQAPGWFFHNKFAEFHYYWTSSDLLEGQWFSSHGLSFAQTTGPGMYLESLVQPGEKHPDGKLWCGENENKLLKEFVFGSDKPLNLTTEYVICGDGKWQGQNGIMWFDTEAGDCKQNLGQSDKKWYHYYLYNDRSNYWYQMVADKAFNNKVPGGSLWELTKLEEYYLKRWSFETTCANSSNTGTGGYKVWDYDASAGRFKEVGWAQKKDGNTDIIYFHWIKESCKDLAWDMHDSDSVVLKAYRAELLKKAKEECKAKYDDMLKNEIGGYIFDYNEAYRYGKNFVRTIEDIIDFLSNDEESLLYTGVLDGNKPDSLDKRYVSPPVVDGLIEYVDNQLSQVINAKVRGEVLFKENAFKKLAEAAKAVLSQTKVGDKFDDAGTYWKVDSTVDDFGPLLEWVDEANKQLATIDKNSRDMAAWRLERNEVDKYWDDDEDGMNIVCKSTEELANEWNNYKKDLPGAPDVDGSFDPSEYIDPNSASPDPPGTKVEASCANSGGAASLGWIVCPVMEWLGDAANEVYEKALEPMLQVKSALFNETSTGKGTKNGWSIFQLIANVVFVILFMMVIFSQLTGVGIDNYGIKKILPKLLVVAILVNLSYYICVICVDLSNILGNGLRNLLDSLEAGGIPSEVVAVASKKGAGGATTVSVVLMVALVAGGLYVAWENPAMILTLLVGALCVVIAALFLFVLLAGREAAIVVLTVISPLAFVCYALPNTKKLFDKWLKMGQGLLLVYPIAGLLMGGGNFVSKLLLNAGMAADGFFGAFAAMIVGIVPIFFIPSVLKGAFAAMGSIGAKLSGLGERMRGGATRGIRNSNGFKNAQRMGLERKTRIKAGLDKNGNLTARGERKASRARSKIGRFFGADKRQAAYMAAAKKDIATGEEANASLTNALSKSAIEKNGGDAKEYYREQFENAAEKGDINGMNSALSAAVSSGYLKDKDIAKIVRDAANGKNGKRINIKDSATRAAWMRDTASKYGNGFLATDFEMRDWMKKGGGGINATALGGHGAWAATLKTDGSGQEIGVDDVKPEDIGKLSGDSLLGMAKAGLIDQGMAQRAMVASPNLSPDKKIMLGALANGAKVENVETFKNEAKALMSADLSGGKTMSIGGKAVTESMRNAWTSVTPESVNVVQNFHGGGQQFSPLNVATEGQSFNVREETASAGTSSERIIIDRSPSHEEVRKAMRDFDAQQRARGNRNWPGNSGGTV